MDWLAAWDDLIVGRLTHCSACAARGATPWVGIQDLASGHSVAYTICQPCRARPGGDAALRARLEARYAYVRANRR